MTLLRLIVFMRLLRHILCLMLLVVVCGLKYGQNNERQSLFDKGSVNTEKWGPAPKKHFLDKRWTESSIRPKRLLKKLTTRPI